MTDVKALAGHVASREEQGSMHFVMRSDRPVSRLAAAVPGAGSAGQNRRVTAA